MLVNSAIRNEVDRYILPPIDSANHRDQPHRPRWLAVRCWLTRRHPTAHHPNAQFGLHQVETMTIHLVDSTHPKKDLTVSFPTIRETIVSFSVVLFHRLPRLNQACRNFRQKPGGSPVWTAGHLPISVYQ
jgi:hypothetical protein